MVTDPVSFFAVPNACYKKSEVLLTSIIVSFAADTRLYSKISSVEDCDSLQSDLNCVYDWAKTN